MGGWNALKSVIRKNDVTKVSIQHSVQYYKSLRNHFRIIVNDKFIQVKNMANNEVLFGIYDDPDIVKNDLKFLLASGGWGGKGYLQFANSSK